LPCRQRRSWLVPFQQPDRLKRKEVKKKFPPDKERDKILEKALFPSGRAKEAIFSERPT